MKQTSAFASLRKAVAPSHDLIPYTDKSLRNDLECREYIWEEVQSSRKRNEIHRYLTAVFDLGAWWIADGKHFSYARRALRMRVLEPLPREHPFASIIRCTADQSKVDKRTRSKWCRVMRYAVDRKRNRETLSDFLKRKGGINECARYAKRWLRQPVESGLRSAKNFTQAD